MKKYGKLLLSAYVMKKIKPGKSQKSKGFINKYGQLALGAYVLNKLKSEKAQKEIEIEPEKEIELTGTDKGTSRMSTGKVLKGALAGATIVGVLAGATALYSYKKYQAKKCVHKIQVE
jgi:hypothetical protein